jgi:hypothetical protein
MTLMDRTEITVRNMLTAVEAPLYDIGVLSDRGMLPGLDSIPAAAVLDRLSLLKYRNARGSHSCSHTVWASAALSTTMFGYSGYSGLIMST